MKIINLNSKYDLSSAQINYVHSIVLGDSRPASDDSIAYLINEIPFFLLHPDSMPEQEAWSSETPRTEWLGFYQHRSSILSVDIPAIGLCPERIEKSTTNEDELILLTSKVIVHELAHAKMGVHPAADYGPQDDFYKWMEEPMANMITMECFCRSHRLHMKHRQIANVKQELDPLEYVRKFISGQPDNYRLGLDLYDHQVRYWWIWRNQKKEIARRTKEKQDWLDYVKAHVGNSDKKNLEQLFEALHTEQA